MKLRDFEVKLASPLGTAKGTITERRGTLVSVGSEDAGENPDTLPVGIGEATPLPGWTESVSECRQALATRADDTPEEALAALSGRPAARHGVSLALADATARQAGQSLATYLADGDTVSDSVPVNATIGVGSPERAATAAEQAVADGFETLKIKVGAGELSNDVDRVRAVEAVVSDAVPIRVDANGAWTPSTAREAVEAFAALGIEYVEQPALQTNWTRWHRSVGRASKSPQTKRSRLTIPGTCCRRRQRTCWC